MTIEKKKEGSKKRRRTIDLENMESHFDDSASLASALSEALQDADEALRKKESKPISSPDSKSGEAEAAAQSETEPDLEEDAGDESVPAEQKPMGLAELPEQAEEEETVEAEPPGAQEEDYYERLLRVKAEFENYKKRVDKDRQNFIRFANEDLLVQFLPVMDNFERAIAHVTETKDIKALLDGVRMVCRQMKDVLGKSGIRSFESAGKPFDPTKHQAIQTRETSDTKPNTVVEEYQRGYFLHDRLVRPALVVVAEPQKDREERVEAAETEHPDKGEMENLSPVEEDGKKDKKDGLAEQILEELEPLDEN